jgi:amidophosphoribosyltransferase
MDVHSTTSSDTLEEKCGVALVRLKKPSAFYQEWYPQYAENLIFRLMRSMLLKQRNRGQDAAGISCVRVPYMDQWEREYMFYRRSVATDPVPDLFRELLVRKNRQPSLADVWDPQVMVGHVLYRTVLDGGGTRFVHPIERYHTSPTRRVALAMNGNFCNNREQRDHLRAQGRWPTSTSDMDTLKEIFGGALSEEHKRVLGNSIGETLLEELEPATRIKTVQQLGSDMELRRVMEKVAMAVRGGYALVGLVGHGDAFFARDPNAIRPLYYLDTELFTAVASEANALYATFNGFGTSLNEIHELPAGHIGTIKQDGRILIEQYVEETADYPCVFETVYFARSTNPGIYNARKELGASLAEKVRREVGDLGKCVISYVPNTSESAALGLFAELQKLVEKEKRNFLLELLNEEQTVTTENLAQLSSLQGPCFDQTLIKDALVRTFISSREGRAQLVTQAYDAVLDMIEKYDDETTVVLVEDSIVKGSTLEKNVIKTLAMVGVKELYVVSSCPQIRYICPYGVEMARLKEFIAFRATIEVIKERGLEHKLRGIESVTRAQQQRIDQNANYCPERNVVQELYSLVNQEDVSVKIAEMITPEGFAITVHVIYPDVNGFSEAIGKGDAIDKACLDGQYPEIGGLRVLNKALLNYFNGSDEKAY